MKHPNSNIQHPENIQAPSSEENPIAKLDRLVLRILDVGSSLDVGAWMLETHCQHDPAR